MLDLTLRNRLLNFGERVSTVQLLCPDQNLILGRLDDGSGIRIREWDEQDEPERAICEGALARGTAYARLVKPGQRRDLQSRLLELSRKARRDLQEGGSNTLFLVIDVLVWKETTSSDRELIAPLTLIPVALDRKSARHDFELTRFDDAPRFNATLAERLRRDFAIDVSALDGELTDQAGEIDTSAVRRKLRRAVQHIPDFQVHSSMMLDTLSFGKYLMWKDLVDRTDELRQNRVVQHILDTPKSPYPAQGANLEPRELDSKTNPAEIFTPLSVDSSQLAAIVSAERGNDFVMIGPPGTGKSQTIANTIAHNLAMGKSVLFVSEKSAALEVVYRRLQNVGLGDFCLELHSNKAKKMDVLRQLGRAWDAAAETLNIESDWLRTTGQLGSLRDHLNGYAERLHTSHRNGFTVHQALGEVVRGSEVPDIRLLWPSLNQHDQEEFDRLCNAAGRLGINANAVGNIADNPLATVANGEWSPAWEQELADAAAELANQVGLVAGADEFAQTLGLSVNSMSLEQLDTLNALAAEIRSAYAKLSAGAWLPKPDDVSDAITSGDWSLEWAQSLIDAAQTFYYVARELEEARNAASTLILATDTLPVTRMKKLADVLGTLAKSLYTVQEKQLAFALSPASDLIIREAREGSNLAERHHSIFEYLSVTYDRDAVVSLDHSSINQTWTEGNNTWWPRSIWLRGRARKALIQGGGAQGKPNLVVDLPLLDEMARVRTEIDGRADYAAMTPDWRGLDTDLAAMQQRLTDAESLLKTIESVAPDAVTLEKLAHTVNRLVDDASQLLAFWDHIAGSAGEFSAAFGQLGITISDFDKLALSELRKIDYPGASFLDLLASTVKAVSTYHSQLREWCGWLRAKGEATARGLAPLVDALENNVLIASDADVERAFRVNYCRWWANAIVSHDDLLRRFVPAEHDSKIADFRNLDEVVQQLSCQYIRARISDNIPNRGMRGNREYSELRRLLGQRRPRRSLRQIFGAIPSVLRELTPCLLMSPLSVAQYLPTDHPSFDLVIFDEASQIPPWDAVGAMARGQQVIVAGDPKQLPPTTFFNHSGSGDDDFADEDIEDLESILDEMDAASLPTVDLKWHYRSENESLIAFSNRRYYDNRLITFPSPATDDRSVRLLPVSGQYERGSSRTNRVEADAVVAEVVKRLTDPAFCDAGRTIGVVTFNSQQQTLIEDLLDEERRKNPDIEPHFSDDRAEPVFVKNLENVQGDERDVILFSITYGPDIGGRVSMQFGPLNKDGGQRRLNVAITRARSELLVFSSLLPDQIDISRTQSEGVHDLKGFLDYAQRGPRAFAEAVSGPLRDWESPFEEAVAKRLEAKGWTVHPQIGVSSYRIDIGVVHPDAPGRYLLGVECDGASYHSSATARDRDKLREDVLRGKGWTLLRVWSTDFWNNPDKAIERVETGIRRELNGDRSLRCDV